MPKPASPDQRVPNCSLPSNFASRRRLREQAGQTNTPRRGGPVTMTMEGQAMVMRSASLRIGDEVISPFDDERKAQ